MKAPVEVFFSCVDPRTHGQALVFVQQYRPRLIFSPISRVRVCVCVRFLFFLVCVSDSRKDAKVQVAGAGGAERT